MAGSFVTFPRKRPRISSLLVCFYCLCVFVYVFYFIATMSFAGYFLSVLFCLLSMLISDSRFDLVWFRLSCDHGWIRNGSVNVRKQQQQLGVCKSCAGTFWSTPQTLCVTPTKYCRMPGVCEIAYLQSMDFQRGPQSKHHLYCEQEKPAHCHGSLLLRLGMYQIQDRTRDAHKISPHGTKTKRTPAMNWDHAVSWGGGLG